MSIKKHALAGAICTFALSAVSTAEANDIRIATFNASLNRFNAGDLKTELSNANSTQIQQVAEVIQRVNPDILLINEFDVDGFLQPNGSTSGVNGSGLIKPGVNGAASSAGLFQSNYLSSAWDTTNSGSASNPINFDYAYWAPSNTGVASGFNLDNDNNGSTTGPNDAYGFGFFEGQYGMLLLSKHEIVEAGVRTFQEFLWKDMPKASLPDDPNTAAPNDWYSPAELDVVRLSSKSHWDIPVNVDGTLIHILASHPTPPVFDGPEDRNGLRNHDEIRFLADYVDPNQNYMADDNGVFGGLAAGEAFAILGDLNADTDEGDSTGDPVGTFLLNNPLINNSLVPTGAGGPDADDTAEFVGGLRVDYVLPSSNLAMKDAGIFWPGQGDQLDALSPSDHRLVFVDVAPVPVPAALPLLASALGAFGVCRRKRA